MSSSWSYSPSYFSLEDILATQERLPVTAAAPLRGLAFLDPARCQDDGGGHHDQDDVLPAGARLDLPLWMARALVKARTSVTVSPPEIYGSRRREQLKAEPAVLALPR